MHSVEYSLIFLGMLLTPTLVGRATKPFVSSLGAFWPGMQALAGAGTSVNGVGSKEGESEERQMWPRV